MSFDKNYSNRKDKRKPYRGSKRFDRTCRNHGSCPYCKRQRLFSKIKTNLHSNLELKQFEKEDLNV